MATTGSWRLRKVRFRLLSPLHIGSRTTGNLQQTRSYVPGRALWGAFACRLARDLLRGAYVKAGDCINEFIRFSYLYPGGEEGPDFFWSTRNFEWLYLNSHTSTALADGHSKLDGSLHETEYIAPQTRQNQPVYLHGFIWQRSDFEFRMEALAPGIQLGSERAYGWGRVGEMRIEDVRLDQCFGCWKLIATRPEVTGSGPLLAHLESPISGIPLEPLVGRATTAKGMGVQIERLAFAHPPGEPVDGTFEVGAFGIWRKLSGG
jgi:hypothetical protein